MFGEDFYTQKIISNRHWRNALRSTKATVLSQNPVEEAYEVVGSLSGASQIDLLGSVQISTHIMFGHAFRSGRSGYYVQSAYYKYR